MFEFDLYALEERMGYVWDVSLLYIYGNLRHYIIPVGPKYLGKNPFFKGNPHTSHIAISCKWNISIRFYPNFWLSDLDIVKIMLFQSAVLVLLSKWPPLNYTSLFGLLTISRRFCFQIPCILGGISSFNTPSQTWGPGWWRR